MKPDKDIVRLLEIMEWLRDPVRGCPWDLEQRFETIAPYTIEEACEVADAIERGDPEDLRDELGDLLLQVVFHARIAEERGLFAFGDVVEAITTKMIRRHPHVFGKVDRTDAVAVKALWAEIKAAEKAERAARRPADAAPQSLLDGVPSALPQLTRAVKIQEKAAAVGFDWKSLGPVIDKIAEEIEEVRAAAADGDAGAVADEIGDLLFAVANLARHAKVDPEVALRQTNAKFRTRFAHIEAELAAEGRGPAEATLEEMEALWQAAKRLPAETAPG